MAHDIIEKLIRGAIAAEIGVPPQNVRPEALLRTGDLKVALLASAALPFAHPEPTHARASESLSWRSLYAIADRIERLFGVRFDVGEVDTWTSVADVICAAEKALARAAAQSREVAA